ncbi:MAG: hydrogen peroxide-inducible genes activator [Rhizobiaceae bacterium]
MKLTLRQMQYVDVLVRHRHFARAADAVNVSQPALSAQIMEMERRLGARLFERSKAGVFPTALCEKLLPVVRRILDDAQTVQDLAAASGGILAGRLRLGVIPTIAPYLLPKLMPRANALFPGLDLQIREGMTRSLIEALQARQVDLALVALPIDAQGLESLSLFQDRFVVAKTPGATDLLVGPVHVDEIPADRLLLLAEGHCLRDHALEVCGIQREGWTVNFEAMSMATLVQLVSNGLGMTLLPEMAVPFENRDGALELVEFVEPCPSRDIGLVWRSGSERSEDYSTFGELVRELAPKAGSSLQLLPDPWPAGHESAV